MSDLYKTGRVRVSLTPNPFKAGTSFRQTLELSTGAVRIAADGIMFRIWADALRPVYHVEIDALHAVAVAAQPEFWKRIPHCAHNDAGAFSPPKMDPPQDVRVDRADGRLRLEPAQVLETFWIAVNPAPDVAGPQFTLDGLLAMQAGTPEDQSRWRKFRGELAEIPLRIIDGRPAIAPAETMGEAQQRGRQGALPGVPLPLLRPGPRQRRSRGADPAVPDRQRTPLAMRAGRRTRSTGRMPEGPPRPPKDSCAGFALPRRCAASRSMAAKARTPARTSTISAQARSRCNGCWSRKRPTRSCFSRPGRRPGMLISSYTWREEPWSAERLRMANSPLGRSSPARTERTWPSANRNSMANPAPLKARCSAVYPVLPQTAA